MRGRIELVVAGLLSVLALALHVVFFFSAGPLWRDEVGSLHTATFPLHLLWQRLNLESFPLLWVMLLRGWAATVGQSVTVLRLLGMLTGIGIVAALWIAGRALKVRVPLFSLAAVALSGAVIRFGDEIRGYGSSGITGLLVLSAMSIASRSGRRRDWFLAGLSAVIAVQTAFLNGVIVLAACVAAMAASRQFMRPLAVGGAAAASLLIYVESFRARASWASIDSVPIDLRAIARGAFAALAKNGTASAFLVAVTMVGALVIGVVRVKGGSTHTVFPLTALLALIVGQTVALLVLRRAIVPWYFVAVLVVIGPCVDALLENLPGFRTIVTLIITAIGLSSAIAYASLRSTNADIVATSLRLFSRPGDFVVVYPWYCGVTLAPQLDQKWTTLPPLSDYSVHRFDLLQSDLGRLDAAQPVLDASIVTLRSGHRVWLAGFPLGSESSAVPDADETDVNRADRRWSAAFRGALRSCARRAMLVVPGDPHVIANERMQLVVFEP